jgi:haloalkane dehalogenase
VSVLVGEPLPGVPWSPASWVSTSDSLRMAVVDVGPRDAPTVLCLHGEPSWSYLYRNVAADLVAAGLRVVIPDLIGFGRSDKPVDRAAHTYAAHVAWLRDVLLDRLQLREVTLLCQDWGGLLGLRLLAEDPDRFRAVVAANTGLPDGTVQMPEVWWHFREVVETVDVLQIGQLVQAGVRRTLSTTELAAYDAPFPTEDHKAGPRSMPGLIPQSPEGTPSSPQT